MKEGHGMMNGVKQIDGSHTLKRGYIFPCIHDKEMMKKRGHSPRRNGNNRNKQNLYLFCPNGLSKKNARFLEGENVRKRKETKERVTKGYKLKLGLLNDKKPSKSPFRTPPFLPQNTTGST